MNSMNILQNTKKFRQKGLNKGLSMIELLIVVAIVVILFIVLLLSLRTQISRGRDAERKTDLEKIKVAFEDYYNDNGCYPPEDVLDNCDSDDFVPYLQSIPCDPIHGEPYFYVPVSGNNCAGYRVYAGLEATDDPSIESAGCDQDDFCGYGSNYNYGISSGVPVYDEDATPFPSPSPSSAPASPSPSPSATPPPSPLYEYACDNNGICNRYNHGEAPENCPVTYLSSDCESSCANPANQCGI